jgi:hypothetical protein
MVHDAHDNGLPGMNSETDDDSDGDSDEEDTGSFS